MNRIKHILLFSLILLTTGCSLESSAVSPYTFRGAPLDGYGIVDVYPHDPGAFTQGLLIHDGRLYEGTGQFGRSTLRELDLETGEIIRHVSLPASRFGEGIAAVGDSLFQLTWRSETSYVYNSETFDKLGELHYEGEGWGLTYDGSHLILSDGTDVLRFLDPATFLVVETLQVWDDSGALHGLNELEYIDGEIYANVLPSDLIARISPETGQVTGWIYLQGLLTDEEKQNTDVLNGIAWDPEERRLFVTGKNWPHLFEIDIIPSQP